MLYKAQVFLFIFVVGELLATIVFRWVLNPKFSIKQTGIAIVEGAMERLFLFLSFLAGINVAIVFFGALKIATHVNPHDNPPGEGTLPKNYYLIGNLLSATLAVAYTLLWRHFVHLPPSGA